MRRLNNAIAFLWGAAEASLFFIVPDVFLSFVAVKHGTAEALRAATVAAAGAIVGGLGLWLCAHGDPVSVDRWLLALPSIDAAMRATVADGMAAGWIGALFKGAITGIPYKLFVAEAALRAIDPALFFLVSMPARLLRFAAVALLAGAIAPRVAERWRVPAWAFCWLAIYAVYFSAVGF